MKKLVQNKKYLLIIITGVILMGSLFIVINVRKNHINTDHTPTAPIPTILYTHAENTNNFIPTSQTSSLNNSLQTGMPFSYHTLVPGQATRDMAKRELGNPSYTVPKKEYAIDYYKIKGTDSYDVLVFKNNIFQYSLEQVINPQALLTDYINHTGKQDKEVAFEVYDYKGGESTNTLHIFPKDGIAFVNDPKTNQTVQVHHFTPSEYTKYLLSAGMYLNFVYTPPDQALQQASQYPY